MPDKQDRSIGELFSDLTNEVGLLIRQEIALAKVEFSQKASRIGTNIGYLVIGGAVAYAALLVLLACVVILLANVMAWWLAALVVAVVVGIVAGVLISRALHALKTTELTPRQTVETLKEDAQWAKEQVK
ncbi:MAG: phage holin family protein [Acidobacteriaceae bacterium]|nr:phage holin family protein [Acidobacteriaceae bacterium]